MQEVPDDAIILTPDEAWALRNYISNYDTIYTSADFDDAIQALDEQLEENNTDR